MASGDQPFCHFAILFTTEVKLLYIPMYSAHHPIQHKSLNHRYQSRTIDFWVKQMLSDQVGRQYCNYLNTAIRNEIEEIILYNRLYPVLAIKSVSR